MACPVQEFVFTSHLFSEVRSRGHERSVRLDLSCKLAHTIKPLLGNALVNCCFVSPCGKKYFTHLVQGVRHANILQSYKPPLLATVVEVVCVSFRKMY